MIRPNFEIVVRTTESFGTPHLEALIKANPGVPVSVIRQPDLKGASQLEAWRNCDREIRDWWREWRGSAGWQHILFLEGDVYANCDLGELLTGAWCEADLVAAKCRYQVTHRLSWDGFREIQRLPDAMLERVMAIEPLAVVLMSRKGLDLIAEERFDEVFSADIFCELRLPTVVRFAGGEVGFCPRLKTVGVTPLHPPFGEVGIWHPVKSEVAI